MTREEHHKLREQRYERMRNMTTEQVKTIDDECSQMEKIDEEIDAYHRQGKIHPAEIKYAKEILAWRCRSEGRILDFTNDDLLEMETYANDILSGATGQGVAIDMSIDKMERMEAWAKMIVSKSG